MSEGRSREDWSHTSSLLAMIFNAAPFRSGKGVKPADFNPHLVAATKYVRKTVQGTITAGELGRMMVAQHR